jgi:hypothetical protein
MSCTCSVCKRTVEVTTDFSSWPQVLKKQVGFYPITRHGNPQGELLGFICTSCFKAASKMQIYIKSIMSGIEVSEHAVTRYLERNDGEPISENAAKASIIRMFDSAKPIVFRDIAYLARMTRRQGVSLHRYKAGWIFITTTAQPYTIKTMLHCKSSNIKLNYDFVYKRSL